MRSWMGGPKSHECPSKTQRSRETVVGSRHISTEAEMSDSATGQRATGSWRRQEGASLQVSAAVCPGFGLWPPELWEDTFPLF